MRISDWSSDVCSSDLHRLRPACPLFGGGRQHEPLGPAAGPPLPRLSGRRADPGALSDQAVRGFCLSCLYRRRRVADRSEEHTSELQSLMRISYAVFCLKKKKMFKPNTI